MDMTRDCRTMLPVVPSAPHTTQPATPPLHPTKFATPPLRKALPTPRPALRPPQLSTSAVTSLAAENNEMSATQVSGRQIHSSWAPVGSRAADAEAQVNGQAWSASEGHIGHQEQSERWSFSGAGWSNGSATVPS